MILSEKAKEIVNAGSIKIRVKRSGMFQQLTFVVKRARQGNIEYIELFTERLVDTPELIRIAEETGLPVEAPNAHVFPKGTSASDFQVT